MIGKKCEMLTEGSLLRLHFYENTLCGFICYNDGSSMITGYFSGGFHEKNQTGNNFANYQRIHKKFRGRGEVECTRCEILLNEKPFENMRTAIRRTNKIDPNILDALKGKKSYQQEPVLGERLQMSLPSIDKLDDSYKKIIYIALTNKFTVIVV